MDEGTKARQSRPQRLLIERPRLTKLLDQSEARVILLLAPAGYGKTTLAREWLATSRDPVAWYSATAASSDVVTLATGLAAEIDAALLDATQQSLARLAALTPIQQRPDVLARILASTRGSWQPMFVAVDDYHLLSSASAEELVGALIQRLPVRFVITTRTTPQWLTSRMSVYGKTLEVTATELALTPSEVDQILREAPLGTVHQSLLAAAGGWPAVVGLAARTRREDFPNALPGQLYDFLADDLLAATSRDVQRALEVIALTGTHDAALARRLIGPNADNLLAAAERTGLLSFPTQQHVALHPLLADFLIARLRLAGAGSVGTELPRLLVESRRWDECLAVAEALPGQETLVAQVLEHALEQLLSSGRVATVDRWVQIAREMGLDTAFVDLAEAETALRRGESRRALTFSSRASQRLASPSDISRAALTAARAAHLLNFRTVARTWFTRADIDGAAPSTRLEALWGQFLVEDEENSGGQEEAAARFEAAGDGSIDHALRVSQAKFMLGFGRGHVTTALAELEQTDALIPLAADPITVLASMNHKAWGLAASARYNEAVEATEHAKEMALAIGIDFAIHYLSFPKAASLTGLRRFAEAKRVLSRLAARVRDEPDGWATANLAIQNARLQISLGDLERAADHLALDPDEYQSPNLRAEFDAYRALIKAALGRGSEAMALAARAQRWSRHVEGYAPSALARAIVAMDSPYERGRRRAIVNYKLGAATGYADSIVIACRARPGLATLIAQQADLRDRLAVLLAESSDEPLARAAGLRVPRSTRRVQTLSPRELEVYELIAQGRTNREIAATLFISESTTKVHVRHILEKLGARSRLEAVQAWRDGPDD